VVRFAPIQDYNSYEEVEEEECDDDIDDDDSNVLDRWYSHDELNEIKLDYERCLKLIVRGILVEDTIDDTVRGTETVVLQLNKTIAKARAAATFQLGGVESESSSSVTTDDCRKFGDGDIDSKLTTVTTMSSSSNSSTAPAASAVAPRDGVDKVRNAVLLEQQFQRYCNEFHQRIVPQSEERIRQASTNISNEHVRVAYQHAMMYFKK
jgi:hypothetical protein